MGRIMSLILVLAISACAGGERVPGYAPGPGFGTWEDVALAETRVGRTAAKDWAEGALSMKRYSDYSETIYGRNSVIQTKTTLDRYTGLTLVDADEMADFIYLKFKSGFEDGPPKPLSPVNVESIPTGDLLVQELSVSNFEPGGKRVHCVTFLHQWRPTERVYRGPRLLRNMVTGILCEPYIPTDSTERRAFVTNLMPELIAAVTAGKP